MTRHRARRSRARRLIENLLLLAGVVALGVWVWSVASKTIYQDWGNWVLDREARGQQATVSDYVREKLGLSKPPENAGTTVPPPAAPPSAAPPAPAPAPAIPNHALLGRISIPRLDLRVVVREGVDEGTLRVAAGHIPGTAFPWQDGNVGVAAHRDTLFRGLRAIRRNDLIRFETPEGNHEYRVESTKIVSPKDVSVLAPDKSPELTLVTCYPFYYVGSAPDRFIVKAREVLHEASAPPAPEVPKPAAAAVSDPPAEEPAPDAKPVKSKVEAKRVSFEIGRNHSRQLAPGISMGVTDTNVYRHRVDGWMWVMPDRRTIWLRDHNEREPVVFYGHADGRMHELVITSVTRNSVKGYLR